MMCEESPAPLSEEFARVVSETQLGDPLVDALERIGKRLEIRGCRLGGAGHHGIQQQVGGRLADLLHTLADFIRPARGAPGGARAHRRGSRISAYVLGALPLFLFFMVSTGSPGYLDLMFKGCGPVWLIGCGRVVCHRLRGGSSRW